METINELEEIVADLNEDVYETGSMLQDEEGAYIELQTTGMCSVITFLGIVVWSSENDDRKYDDEDDEYEDLDIYIRRRINYICEMIGKIKVEAI